MQLYSYFNSSTSYRVRIALALKGLAFDYRGVDIRIDAHRAPGYVDDINPAAAVPALVEGDLHLGQSLAIIDYLDARHPQPRLIPEAPVARARVLEFSALIACDIHPVNNLRVLKRLEAMGIAADARRAWYHHWVAEGLASAERLLALHGGGPFCFGDSPTLADCCLVPQIFNARRQGCDLSGYPRLVAANDHAVALPAFRAAEPGLQPDADR